MITDHKTTIHVTIVCITEVEIEIEGRGKRGGRDKRFPQLVCSQGHAPLTSGQSLSYV